MRSLRSAHFSVSRRPPRPIHTPSPPTATQSRSALGLQRISDIEVSQLLRATSADICRLRSFTEAWNISKFESWPLLLRALTHPSMSNWAERILNLQKHSMGPNALELLGDRVVGVCVAKKVHEWMKEGAANRMGFEDWALRYGVTSLMGSLTGNRGMAWVARNVGLEQLMRWEKALPPSNHRGRLREDGVDVTTGLQANREVNGLAAAYESVAAAAYLDGGIEQAEQFVEHTLLDRAKEVHVENKSTREFELELVKEIASWVGVPLWDLWMWGQVGGREEVMKSLTEKLEVTTVDLVDEDTVQASPVHYAGIVLRKSSAESLEEADFIGVSSHFSVEMARNAALIQALESLRGERAVVQKKPNSAYVLKKMMVRGEDGSGKGTVEVKLDKEGCRWFLDGDYGHVARLLKAIGVPKAEIIPDTNTTKGTSLREALQLMSEQRRTKNEQRKSEAERIKSVKRRNAAPAIDLGTGRVCTQTISECLELGKKVYDNHDFSRKYQHLYSSRGADGGDEVAQSISETVERLSSEDRRSQLSEVRSLNCIGQHTYRLWSVQRSMRDVNQDRSEIMELSVRRLTDANTIEDALFSRKGLDGVDEVLRVRSGLFALGVCTNVVGLSTALQWLSGAEIKAQGS